MIKNALIVIQVLIVASGINQEVGHAGPYELVEIGTLGGGISRAYSINDRGEVVGESTTGQGRIAAFIWSATEGMRMVGEGPGENQLSSAQDINNLGQITGTFGERTRCPSHAFLADRESFIDIGTLCVTSHCLSFGNSINDSGTVLGTSRSYQESSFIPFLMNLDLGLRGIESVFHRFTRGEEINNYGEVVLEGAPQEDSKYYLIDRNQTIIPLEEFDFVGDLNDETKVVGRSHSVNGLLHPLLYSEGVYTEMNLLGSTFGTALSINERNQSVGYLQIDRDLVDAFIWENGRTVMLSSLLEEPGSVSLSFPQSINNSGQVVGVGSPRANPFGYLLNPSPNLHNGLLSFHEISPIDPQGDAEIRVGLYSGSPPTDSFCGVQSVTPENLIVDLEIDCHEYLNSTAPSGLTLTEFLVKESIDQVNSSQDFIRAATTGVDGEVYLACEFPIVARLCATELGLSCDSGMRAGLDNCGYYNLCDEIQGNESSQDMSTGLGIEFTHFHVDRMDLPPLPTQTPTHSPTLSPTPSVSPTPFQLVQQLISLPARPDDIVVDPDQPYIYFVSNSKKSAYKVDLSTGLTSASIEFSLPPEQMGFSRLGRKIGVTLPVEHVFNDGPDTGYIGVISVDDWSLESEVFVQIDPWDIAIDDNAVAYLTSGSNQHVPLRSFDLETGELISTSYDRLYMRQNIRMHPDFQSVCLADTSTVPRCRSYFQIEEGLYYQDRHLSISSGGGIRPHFRFSPTGNLIFSAEGNIFSVTTDCASNLARVGTLSNEFSDISFHPESNTILSVDGTMKSVRRHSLETFEDSGLEWPTDSRGEFIFVWNDLVAILGANEDIETPSGWAIEIVEMSYFLSDPPPTPTQTNTPTPTETPTPDIFNSDSNDRIDAIDLIALIDGIQKGEIGEVPEPVLQFSLYWMTMVDTQN